MTYGAWEFIDSITDALGVDDDGLEEGDVSGLADRALEAIERLEKLNAAMKHLEAAARDGASRADLCRGACVLMRKARELLRKAEARKAADYAARALKSAEGAVRHAERIGAKP